MYNVNSTKWRRSFQETSSEIIGKLYKNSVFTKSSNQSRFVLLLYWVSDTLTRTQLSVNSNYAVESLRRQICYWHLQKCETILPTRCFSTLLSFHVWSKHFFFYICTRLPFPQPSSSSGIVFDPIISWPFETFLLSLNPRPQTGQPYKQSFFWPPSPKKHPWNQRTARLQQAKSREGGEGGGERCARSHLCTVHWNSPHSHSPL